MSLQSNELLQLIHSKQSLMEKQSGIIPMDLVFRMLKSLDYTYNKEFNISIFTETSFKWFFPASDMGNFPLGVYLKLMEGLKLKIDNEEKRKKHIIENMLFISEPNEKNVEFINEVFNCPYKLNLYQGNSLNLNTENIWNIKHFDVVIGSPPIQIVDTTLEKNIWELFVLKALNEWARENKYVVFIHPSTWRKPDHYLWNIITNKELLAQVLFLKDEAKILFNYFDMMDYYVLKNSNIKCTDVTNKIKKICK